MTNQLKCCLKGLNIKELWHTIDTKESVNYLETPKTNPAPTKENNKQKFNFLNYQSNKINFFIVFIEHIRQYVLPLYTDKPCWNCRECFTTNCYGCPLEYRKYSNDMMIAQHIREELQKSNIQMNNEYVDFFETEGIFCSLDCVKNYILENIPINPIRYNQCLTLFGLLKCKLLGTNKIIRPADTWKVLEKWGGTKTIEQYRDNLDTKSFRVTPNIKRPYMFPVGDIIEEMMIK